MFYVYAYIRSENSSTSPAGTPYYIGKGQTNRAWSKRHRVPIPKVKRFITILENNLTEIGSAALERRYIKWWGRKDLGTGILLNRTDGGEGSAMSPLSKIKLSKRNMGHPVSNEAREKMSISATGRKTTQETKEKLSNSLKGRISPNKGNVYSDEAKDKIRKYQTGRKKSKETIQKMREREIIIVFCPHCSKSGGNAAMFRWHFDNCKEKL